MKRHFLSYSLFFTFALFVTASCSDNTAEKKTESLPAAGTVVSQQQLSNVPTEKIFRSISPSEAKSMLDQRRDMIFLDVRTPEERAQGYIAGSQLVSFWDVAKGQITLPADKPILLVCAVGGRSYAAGQILAQKGHGEVYNLGGGINAWYRAGLPITR